MADIREYFGQVDTPEVEVDVEVSQRVVGDDELAKIIAELRKYKEGKGNLEQRIIQDEEWWKLRHWEVLKKQGKAKPNASPEPTSAWLFNAILNKHADAMDNYPEPVVLPRERSDEESAKTLSSVLPVVMEHNDFQKTYWENWWEKLKHGTGAYGVFWNNEKDNGLGDIDIHPIDLLNLFWQPGVSDIQKSKYLFIVDLQDNDLIQQAYPEVKDKLGGDVVDVAQYLYDDTVDTSNKSAIVDCYYKVTDGGKTILHYIKFVGNTILYATENDPKTRMTGLYDHGKYPVVLDVLFPEKGTPVGFGYVTICKDPQIYIDKLSGYVMENAMMTTKKRFFISESTNINEEEFLDWTKPLVHCATEVTDNKLREIVCEPLDDTVLTVIQMKEEEMKDTASNRDVNSGSASSGVTSGAAIAALQEAGNKASRDMISASYRAYTAVADMCIELIRQFYDEARAFRITGDVPGQYNFVNLDNSKLGDQPMIGQDGMPIQVDGTVLFRKPIFDLKLVAQKKNPFSRMEQNERALNFYSAGFFNAENAQASLTCLEMMDFEGIEKMKEKVSEGQTLLQIVQQQQQQIQQLMMMLGVNLPNANGNASGGTNTQSSGKNSSSGLANTFKSAKETMTPYQQRLAENSTPSMGNK